MGSLHGRNLGPLQHLIVFLDRFVEILAKIDINGSALFLTDKDFGSSYLKIREVRGAALELFLGVKLCELIAVELILPRPRNPHTHLVYLLHGLLLDYVFESSHRV